MTVPGTGVDLAARWLGASVLAASDESFGLKENLLVEAAPSFEPGHYDHRGEIVDGWETRRRRAGSHDWAIVRLGAPGRIELVDVDTSHFTGNVPTTCWIEGLGAEGYPGVDELLSPGADWHEIVPPSGLRGDAHNLLAVDDRRRFTHLRLSAFPDGGIARLRVHGTVVADPRWWDGRSVELSGIEEGGRVVCSSDEFYSSAHRLLRPDHPATMGEGWETARRRSGECDAVVFALAAAGRLDRVEVDTTHFKYNASAAFALWGTADVLEPASTDAVAAANWQPLMGRTPLQPDTRHRFAVATGEVAAVRLDAYPDGGLARVRLFGVPTAAEHEAAERSWLSALPDRQRAAVRTSGTST
jgi:allantoicase